MTTQHTKGPWKTWTTKAPHAPVIIYTGDIPPVLDDRGHAVMLKGGYVATVSSNNMHLNERDDIVPHDNARLIAAAPDLLEALTECLNQLQTNDANGLKVYRHLTNERRNMLSAAQVMAKNAIAKARGE